MAEFTSDVPEFMTFEERAYYERAVRDLGINAGSFWNNVIRDYFDHRDEEMPPIENDDEEEIRHFALMNDAEYADLVRDLHATRDATTLWLAKLYKTQDAIMAKREEVRDKVGDVLISKNMLRDMDVLPKDIIGPNT